MNRLRNICVELARKPLQEKLAGVDRVWERKAELAVQESDDLYHQGRLEEAIARLVILIEAATTAQTKAIEKDTDFTRMGAGWIRTHTTAAIQRSEVWNCYLWDCHDPRFQAFKDACAVYGWNVEL